MILTMNESLTGLFGGYVPGSPLYSTITGHQMAGLAFDLLTVTVIRARKSFIDISRQQLARYAQESHDQQGHERCNKSNCGRLSTFRTLPHEAYFRPVASIRGGDPPGDRFGQRLGECHAVRAGEPYDLDRRDAVIAKQQP
jgi:hypothetical protein